MSRATSDDQLKFLLSCVRHSNNGKIDFIDVAKECGVVSKGAAAKRYERLLKANGIHPSGGPAERSPSSTPKQKTKADIIKSAAAKRRKIEGDTLDWQIDDEDDFKPHVKHEHMDTPHIKPDPGLEIMPRPLPLPYPIQHHTPYTQQPQFFARPYMPPMSMHFPYAMPHPHPQLSQSTLRPHTITQQANPVSVPQTPQPISQAISQPHTQSTVPPQAPSQQQNQPVATTQPQPEPPQVGSVTEEQIDTMFAEFCAQDMFKTPSFDTSAPVPAPQRFNDIVSSDPITSSAAEQPATESQVSPKTTTSQFVDIVEPEPHQSQSIEACVMGEQVAIQDDSGTTGSVAVEQRGPSGIDAENSILIVD